MICAGPAYPGWPGWALRPTWRTKSSIIRPARSQGLQPCINDTSFFRNEAKRLTFGERISAQFSTSCPAGTVSN